MPSYTLKKSLGQHFLKDEAFCEKIVEGIEKRMLQRLVEVGPGGGAITKYLYNKPGIDFKAVEFDHEKVIWLQSQFAGLEDKIIEADFLAVEAPFNEPFMVVGNFPYNISTQIVFKVLDWRENVPAMVGMFQKEVGLRICAKPGSKTYGILSVLCQAFYYTEYLFDVPPEAFLPPPKVTSGVVSMIRKPDTPVMRSEKDFFNLVKTAFNQRRKMLRNGVQTLFPKSILTDVLFSKRPEQLSVEEFCSLTFKMSGGES